MQNRKTIAREIFEHWNSSFSNVLVDGSWFNARLVIFNYDDDEGERREEKITAMRPRRWGV